MTFGEDHDDDDDCESDEQVRFAKAMFVLRMATQQLCEGEFPADLPNRLALLFSVMVQLSTAAHQARLDAVEAFQDEDEVTKCHTQMLNDLVRAAVNVAMRFAEADKDPLPRFSLN